MSLRLIINKILNTHKWSDMEQVISKEEVDKLMKIKGEVRGIAIKSYANFVLKEEGKEGLKKLEEAMAKIGYPIKYRDVKLTSFYSLGLEAITLTAIKRLFNYDDKKFQEMGRFESRTPIVIRLFMKYFVSIEMTVKKASKMWRKYFTVGNLRVVKLDREKRYAILRIENFHFIPILCENLKGYIASIIEIVIKEKTTCEETKCIHRGDEYHEFLVKW